MAGRHYCVPCRSKEAENIKLKGMIENMRHWLRNIPVEWLKEELISEIPDPQETCDLTHNLEDAREPMSDGLERDSPRIMEVLVDPGELMSQDLEHNSSGSVDSVEDSLNGDPQALGTPTELVSQELMESFYPKMRENDPSFLNVKNAGHDIQDTDRVKYLADEKDVMEQKCPAENLEPELETNSKKKPKLSCEECGYSTPNHYHLKRHKESNHEGIRYPCDQCEASYTTKSSLESHRESVHEGLRYQCNECHYSFTKSYNLVRHTRSKHGNVRYPCDQCEYSATDEGYLKKHQKRMHLS